jgi:hypothetical protein
VLPEDKRNVTMVDIVKPEATFTVELPERAVRALALIGGFGESALEQCVASVLSPMEAKKARARKRKSDRSNPQR